VARQLDRGEKARKDLGHRQISMIRFIGSNMISIGHLALANGL
jgi:hypothetical protein